MPEIKTRDHDVLPAAGFRPADYVLGMAFDLKLILFFLIIMFLLILAPGLDSSILRQVLGLVMFLFIPGYPVVAALFPDKKDIGGLERFLLSFTFSVAALGLGGLGLNYTPWGIHPVSLMTCLSLLIIVCTMIANKRRHDLPEEERFYMGLAGLNHAFIDPLRSYLNPSGGLNKAVNIILVVSIVLSVATLAYAVVLPKQGENFTEFYILGPNGRASNYPATATLGNGTEIIVGAINHEHRNVSYDLVVSLNDSKQNTRLYSEQLKLGDNQTWEKKIYVVPDRAGTDMKLEFLLYKDGELSTPYRDLHIWMNVTAPGEA